MQELRITDDLDTLLNVLPDSICGALRKIERFNELIEIVMDLGRIPEARYVATEIVPEGKTIAKEENLALRDGEVTQDDLDYVLERIGNFDDDNRAGITRTLHRISGIMNRRDQVVGITCRVGRAVYGTLEIIEDIISSGKSILLLGRPGVGKCVTGDTLVLTADGLKPMAGLIPDKLADDQFAPIDATVYGYAGLEQASHAYNGGWSATVKVATRHGYALEGTPEHPILVLTPCGEVAFKPLSALGAGEMVAIQRGQGLFGSNTRLPERDSNALESAKGFEDVEGGMPKTMTEDLARFLGYLLSGGIGMSGEGTGISSAGPMVQAEPSALTRGLFGLDLGKRLEGGDWNAEGARTLRYVLARLGVPGDNPAAKGIPESVLSAPKPMVTAFLQALFEAAADVAGQGMDGTTDGSCVALSSDSARLIEHVQVLLLNYGIISHRSDGSSGQDGSKRGQGRAYLTLSGQNAPHFASQIGFLSVHRRAQLAQALAAATLAGTLAASPVRRGLAQAAQVGMLLVSANALNPHFGLSDDVAGAEAKTEAKTEAGIEAKTEAGIDPCVCAEPLASLFFDPVDRVTSSVAQVFDLTVPGTHSFFANGLVSHNTTMLREAARVLAETKRVVIVDTSNEIGGDGDIPHPAVGRARRMQVSTPSMQHEVMIEAVENHNPQVIVIDEIGREQEAEAARTIAERGVQLIGTAHGQTIENLMINPTLNDLIGGIESVTLSDEEARRRGTQKTVLERRSPPTFDVLVEIRDRHRLLVHHNVSEAVDALLRQRNPIAELRFWDDDGRVRSEKVRLEREDARKPDREGDDPPDGRRRRNRYERDGGRDNGRTATREGRDSREGIGLQDSRESAYRELPSLSAFESTSVLTPARTPAVDADLATVVDDRDEDVIPLAAGQKMLRVFAFGISKHRLKQAAKQLGVPAMFVDSLSEADVLITAKSYYRQRPRTVVDAEQNNVPIYVLRSNSASQMESSLADLFGLTDAERMPYESAMEETEEAIRRILSGERVVDLSPQNAFVRRQQHQLARASNLVSHSYGKEPMRRVRIFRE